MQGWLTAQALKSDTLGKCPSSVNSLLGALGKAAWLICKPSSMQINCFFGQGDGGGGGGQGGWDEGDGERPDWQHSPISML